MSQSNPKIEQSDEPVVDSSVSATVNAEDRKLSVWQRLVEPVKTITDPGERRKASLVSGLLLALAVAMSSGTLVNIFAIPQSGLAIFLGTGATSLLIAYALSRTKHYKLARTLMMATIILIASLDVFLQEDYSRGDLGTILAFNIISILIASTIISLRITLFLVVGNFLWIACLPLFNQAILLNNLVTPLIFNGVVSSLILVLAQSRNLTEKDRLAEQVRINDTLQMNIETLNARTRELNARTRDLALAAELGHAVSQVRALDVMLKDACELILKEFNLYYVQVYLVDPSRTKLLLEAGTGEVGAQLLGRGHNLPLNSGSINGRAAVEKRSVVISDTTQSATFLPNPLLPDTRGEMAVPLIVADRVVGVLDMQNRNPGVLSAEILPAFEALAGQLAIAIQNANLLAETEQARAEVEKQARRLSRTNWRDYLDAIHKPEQISFVYDQNAVKPLDEVGDQPMSAEVSTVAAPISVTGEALGNLVVELEQEKQTAQTKELINTVARQVAQQIESLRLLESAERYRNEAEQAARRLTREGWEGYKERAGGSLGYLYDLKEVRPLNGNEPADPAVTVPLKVRDEHVGKLAVQGLDANDSDALDLASAVAERLSEHIENLRLAEETEQAYIKTKQLSRQNELILDSAGEGIFGLDVKGNHTFINPAAADMLGYAVEELIGRQSHSTWHHTKPNGSPYPAEECPIYRSIHTGIEQRGNEVFIRKDGSKMDVAFTATPIFEGDDVSGAVVTFTDITQQKREQQIIAQRARELAAVAEISTASSREPNVQKMLETVVHLTQRKFGLYHAHVFLFNEMTRELEIAACGWKEGDEHEGTHGTPHIPFDQEQSLVARATRTRQPVIVNDVHSDPGWLPNPLLPNTQAEMAIPLVIGDQVLGVLDVQSDRLNAFSEEDANIQTTLASQVATSLQNARTFSQARQQAERESMLNTISQKIQSATTVEAVLQIAARELGHAIGAPLTIAQLGLKPDNGNGS